MQLILMGDVEIMQDDAEIRERAEHARGHPGMGAHACADQRDLAHAVVLLDLQRAERVLGERERAAGARHVLLRH
jgi:hypothetical protein